MSVIILPISGLILGLRPANERQRYFVSMSLIGWMKRLESALNLGAVIPFEAQFCLCHNYVVVKLWLSWSISFQIRPNAFSWSSIFGAQYVIKIILRSTIEVNGHRADSRFMPSQWKIAQLCNDASHWQDRSLEAALSLQLPLEECTPYHFLQELSASRVPFYKHGLTLIAVWIRNHMTNKVWDEITFPSLNFNNATVEVLEWISIFIP